MTPSLLRRSGGLLPAGAAALLVLAACNDTKSADPSNDPVGTVATNPATGRRFVYDQNFAGQTQDFRLSRIAYGRLVDIYAYAPDGTRVLTNANAVVDPRLEGDGFDFILDTSTLGGRDELTIVRTLDGGSEEASFNVLLRQLMEGLEPIQDVGYQTTGFFTQIPRNAAIQVVMNDLIDPATITDRSIRMLTGTPSTIPFEARILADPNWGSLRNLDGAGGVEFYTTRIVIDLTISEVESFGTDPPLAPNSLGLPAALNASIANVQLQIPTVVDPALGQDIVLANPSAHSLQTAGGGSVDFTAPLSPIIRNARSGGPTAVTGDQNNGFLLDPTPPSVMGVLDATIIAAPQPQANPTEFFVPLVGFESLFCSQQLEPGDILVQGPVVARVTAPSTSPVNGEVGSINVTLLQWPPSWGEVPDEWASSAVGACQVRSAWDPVADEDKETCFVRISPTPLGYPENPTSSILTSSRVAVRFTEPMAGDSMEAFESLRLTRKSVADPNLASYDWIVGSILGDASLESFEFTPALPLAHTSGLSESYFFSMTSGAEGPTDLAGNPLEISLPEVPLSVWTGGTDTKNGGRVSRFTSADEDLLISDPNNDDPFPFAEWGGDIVFQQQLGVIRPRPVSRFQGVIAREPVADNGALSGDVMVNAMPPSPTGKQDPLSRFGSRTQFLWRFVDVGFNLIDRDPGIDPDDPTDDIYEPDASTYNLDVEGAWWTPIAGTAVPDSYDVFEMRMSHAAFLPDEQINPMTLAPIFPDSGLVTSFNLNQLSTTEDPQRIVHTRDLGYIVSPGDLIQVGTNTKLMPWPMNRTIPPSQHRYYTWRDTALRTRGGPGIAGVDLQRWFENNPGVAFPLVPPPGVDVCDDPMNPPVFHPFYSAEQVQSIALPLLIEIRCFPDDGASGANKLDTSIAIPQGLASGFTTPNFRSFATGGYDQSGNEVYVNPDLQDFATGGFDNEVNPNAIPPQVGDGAPTIPVDNNVYMGALDFVVRTSRCHSIWWEMVDAQGNGFPTGDIVTPVYSQPVLDPPATLWPTGTNIEVAFRGASSVNPYQVGPGGIIVFTDPSFQVLEAATKLDRYGDHYDILPSICDNSINHNEIDVFTGENQVNTPVSFLTDSNWREDVNSLSNAMYYQVRITFTSNAQSMVSPYLSSFALTWQE